MDLKLPEKITQEHVRAICEAAGLPYPLPPLRQFLGAHFDGPGDALSELRRVLDRLLPPLPPEPPIPRRDPEEISAFLDTKIEAAIRAARAARSPTPSSEE